MDNTRIGKLEERRRKEDLFRQVRRERMAPLAAERGKLLAQMDEELARFTAGAVPNLEDATLAVFDEAARAGFEDSTPSLLRDRLRQQSIKAASLCKRYEKEHDIHGLGVKLPELEEHLAARQTRMASLTRELERLEVELLPLSELPTSLHVRPKSATAHILRYLTNPAYRAARKILAPLETSGETLSQKLERQAKLRMDMIVQDQELDLLKQEAGQNRNWLEAYVEAWTSRLNDTQILETVRQDIADRLHSPPFRHYVEKKLERHYPPELNTLFERIAAVDEDIRRFHARFDMNYEAGRVSSIDGELAPRRRTPSNIGGTTG